MSRKIFSILAAALAMGTSVAPGAPATPVAHRLPLDQLPISQHVKVPIGPGWLAVGFGSLWVSKSESRQLLRVDPGTNRVIATIAVGHDPELGIGMGLGSVWVPDPKDHTITQVNPDTNRVVRVIKAPLAAETEGSIGVGAGSLWVITNTGGSDSGTLTRIDAHTGRVTANIPVQPQSHAAIFAFDAVWVTSSLKNTVSRVDPQSNHLVESIAVPPQPRFLIAGDDAVWVLSQGDGSLTRIDALTRRVVARIAVNVPGEGGDLSVGDGAVWVGAEGIPLSKVDPVRNEMVYQFVGGEKDDTMRVGFGSVWVLSELDGDIWRVDLNDLKKLPFTP